MVEVVLQLVNARFGPPNAAIQAAIEACTDPEGLKAMVERAIACSSVDELISGD